MIPRVVDPDLVYDNYNDRLDDLLQNFLNEGLIDENLLPLVEQQHKTANYHLTLLVQTQIYNFKYRYRHMAKLDWKFLEKVDLRNPFTTILYGKYRPIGYLKVGHLMPKCRIFTLADANIYDMGIKRRERLISGDFIKFQTVYIFTKLIH